MPSPPRLSRSYANVASTLALVLAVTGTAAAAVVITGRDVRNSSLTGIDVKDKSLSKADFKGSVRGKPGPGSFGDGSVRTDEVTLAADGDWTTITDLSFKAPQDGKLILGGAVEQRNTAKAGEGAVELRIVHNGETHELPSGSAIEPGQLGVGHVSITCNGIRGPVNIQLQARAIGSDIQIGHRTLTMTLTNPLVSRPPLPAAGTGEHRTGSGHGG